MNNSSPTVLFFPWEIGAGHTGRCLVVADILRSEGYRCIFSNDPTGMVRCEGFEVFSSYPAHTPRVKIPVGKYLAVPSLDSAFAGAGYYHPQRLAAQLERDRSVIQAIRPHFIVTHMQPTAVIAARLEHLPIVSIADADFLETGPTSWMSWFTGKPNRLTPYPSSVPAFNQLLADSGLSAITDASDLMYTDLVMIASTPELEPLTNHYATNPAVHYVGPLIWNPEHKDVIARLAKFQTSARPRVYVTLGSGEVATQAAATTAIQAAKAAGWALFLATGYAVAQPEASTDANILLHSFGGIQPALEWADAVICHGGHSTILASLLAGKPMVVVPAMSENEANGRSMVAGTGAGFLFWHTEVDAASGKLKVIQRYPDLPAEPILSTDKLSRAVNELLSTPQYTLNAQQQAKSLQSWVREGPEHILQLIKTLDIQA